MGVLNKADSWPVSNLIKFKTYLGIAQALRHKFVVSLYKCWLKAIKSPALGFTHNIPHLEVLTSMMVMLPR